MLLTAAASALLRGLGVFLFYDLREWPPDVRTTRHQPMFQPPDEIFVSFLRHAALLRSPHRSDLVALGGWLIAVSFKRVAAREEVATAIAEKDFQRVRLRGLAVTLELLKVFKLRVRAEAALNCLDRPTREVGLRSLEE